MPRLLNQAAHQALCLACSAAATEVDAEAALEALAHLGLTYAESSEGVETSSPPEAISSSDGEEAGAADPDLPQEENHPEEGISGEDGSGDEQRPDLFMEPRQSA